MSTAAMHREPASAAPATSERPCDTCGTPFAPRKPWQRFCGKRCHTAFHTTEARRKAIEKRALRMYETLVGLAAVEGPVGEIARLAIKDLKAPESPKALLEKALA